MREKFILQVGVVETHLNRPSTSDIFEDGLSRMSRGGEKNENFFILFFLLFDVLLLFAICKSLSIATSPRTMMENVFSAIFPLASMIRNVISCSPSKKSWTHGFFFVENIFPSLNHVYVIVFLSGSYESLPSKFTLQVFV